VIEATIERWHKVISGDTAGLDDLLADDVVFYSPVVFLAGRDRGAGRLPLLRRGGLRHGFVLPYRRRPGCLNVTLSG
jgi:hypothetical protein